ncbi:hypothetical protein CC2G_004363 [Coprinopsis cinerea AmutBmut pab1-1]|nr:hypothetical protein CC2G_004363 [Coprinopsis cinerea AmutBmut pab1-1]
MSFDVIFSTIWYVMGVFFLVQTRIVAIPYFKMEGCEGNEQEERLWSFGQLVPMLLLLAPMIATMDAYSKVSTCGRDWHRNKCCHEVGTSPAPVSPRS